MRHRAHFPRIAVMYLVLFSGVPLQDTSVSAEHNWPFYRPRNADPPEVSQPEAVHNAIDAFVVKRLEDAGLEPAPYAPPPQLIRRLYFDLIGLPPDPDTMDTFLEDYSSRTYEELVDRLLNDSRYGERWGRLWLDLARYADTAGYEGDPDLPHAWRYRDYVIDTFNNDKPYDLFIKEQIAGDEFEQIMGAGELPLVPPERAMALTFLRLAPFTEPRGDETRHEMLSEMVSTVSSVFLGLTVGCAKCHDHKYDEIPAKDFYRLKAFFATVSMPPPELGDIFQIGGSLPVEFYREGEPQWAIQLRIRFERELQESKNKLTQLKEKLTGRLEGRSGFGLQSMGGPLGNDYVYSRTPVHEGRLHTSIVNCDSQKWEFFTDSSEPDQTGRNAGMNRGQWFGDIPDPRYVTLGQLSAGPGRIDVKNSGHVGEFCEILIYSQPLSPDKRDELQAWLQWKYNGNNSLASSPTINGPPRDGLGFWLDASDLDANANTSNPDVGSKVKSWVDRVGGVTLSQDNSDLQPRLVAVQRSQDVHRFVEAVGVRFEDDFLAGLLGHADFSGDQQGSIVVVYTTGLSREGYGFAVGGEGALVGTFINPKASALEQLESIVNDPDNQLISDEDRETFRRLLDRERLSRQQIKRILPLAMSLQHSFGPPFGPGVPVSRVMIRGEYDNLGEMVEPGFLSCITGHQEAADIRLDPFKRWPTRSRRMALAHWIASPDNPLTARVMVNRLWHWHFGRGIVPTTSDFGALSDGPSHPELLDWLAVKFVAKNWSIKALHRLIVTSATYRRTSLYSNKRALELDPNNRLLWRFRRRHLEAEAVRDSVLVVSGRLNQEQFGLPIFPPLPDGIEHRVKYTESKWDTQHGTEGRKRSIYIYQQRSLTMPFMQSFDSLVCEESRPRRRHSSTPLQALAMYNGRFVSEEARHFAGRVRAEAGDDINQQIERAFRIALFRQPSTQESVELRTLAEADEAGLVGVCRVLLNCNEFVYID